MDCSRLTAEQIERMMVVTRRQRDYLFRLVERMRITRFPPDDPVYLAAVGALEKSANLCVAIAKFVTDDDITMPRL